MKINFSKTSAAIFLAHAMSTYSPSVLACDTCAQAAIDRGFAALIAQAELIESAIRGVDTQVDSLKENVQEAGTNISDSIDTFSKSLETTLLTANERLIRSLSGLYVQVDNQFTILGQAEKNNTLELQNEITSSFQAAEKLIRTRAEMYEVGGSLANFSGGDRADALLHLFTNNTGFSQGIYALEADFLKRWNRRDEELFVNNRAGYFERTRKLVLDEADELIARKNISSLISKDDYQKLIYFAAFGLNPDRILPTEGAYGEVVVKQATLLRSLVSKAPIIPLSDENKEFFGDYTPRNVDASECVTDYVEKGMIPSGVSCTSLDSVLATLVARPGMPSFIIASSTASKRALAEEQLRSTIIGNILFKRMLDEKRAENTLGSL
ncbi:hypothetical protein [Marinomonas sp. 2405UD68-3]|uniref:hypothetical protein n=1 Tax=Marinomonas sp. 2405UD68-3 TaxID=3391835 RepID=UPI0039C9BE24